MAESIPRAVEEGYRVVRASQVALKLGDWSSLCLLRGDRS